MKASSLLGRKFSAGRLKRHREACARRAAAGLYAKKRSPETLLFTITCAYPPCTGERRVVLLKSMHRKSRYYCSRSCQVQHNHELRRKIPADRETLYDLYVTKGLTTTEIGKMFSSNNSSVGTALRLAGIPRRKGGPRARGKTDNGNLP